MDDRTAHICRDRRGDYEAECGAVSGDMIYSRALARRLARRIDVTSVLVCSRCLAIHAVQQRPVRSPLAWLRRHVEVLAVRRRIRASR